MSTKETNQDYHIEGFPVFFILDEYRIIRAVINGYGINKTDENIKKSIDKLL